jgi:hypothetical protein
MELFKQGVDEEGNPTLTPLTNMVQNGYLIRPITKDWTAIKSRVDHADVLDVSWSSDLSSVGGVVLVAVPLSDKPGELPEGCISIEQYKYAWVQWAEALAYPPQVYENVRVELRNKLEGANF